MALFCRAKRAEQCRLSRCRPANICSLRGFRILTLTGHRLEWNSAPQHLDFRTIQACPKDLPASRR
jgi:hypothetical protein